MIEKLEITIQEILDRKSFKKAQIIAGRGGITNNVKWSHILETTDIKSFINGGELILTTGYGLQLDKPDGVKYIKEFIKHKAAGLCIELGTHVDSVSKDVIHYADLNNFPIIIFNEIVKFVDITQDLHSLIINSHHQKLHQINILSKRLNELSLSANGILKILQEVYTNFRNAVFFITDDFKFYCYPAEMIQLEKSASLYFRNIEERKLINQSFIHFHNQTFFVLPVKGLGQIWGFLCIQSDGNHIDEFIKNVLDRTALVIAQIMLRHRTMEEKKQNEENKVVRNLLLGIDCKIDEVNVILQVPSNHFRYRILVINTNPSYSSWREYDWDEIMLQRSILLRSLLKKYSLFPAITISRNEIGIVCYFKPKEQKKNKDMFHRIIEQIKNVKEKHIFEGSQCLYGISKEYENISFIHQGYKEAKQVIELQEKQLVGRYLYEEIGVFQLLTVVPCENLISYIQDYLGPILSIEDKDTKCQLLKTLEIYLQNNCSKKDTAEQLFIVRQTLYHRLEKIKQLLGEKILQQDYRLALEIAIKAYRFIHSGDKEIQKKYDSI